MDEARIEQFGKRLSGDLSATVVIAMCALGDRLGLFKELAANGPATSHELAGRADISERYAREWLSSLACAGYFEYDPGSRRFTLPAEHVPFLAEEGGPRFVGGSFISIPAAWNQLDRIEELLDQKNNN